MSKEVIKVMNNDEIRDFCIKKDLKIFELEQQLQQKENIIKEVREEVKIYEEQSNDGKTNELDNYVFVQRLKIILDKGE